MPRLPHIEIAEYYHTINRGSTFKPKAQFLKFNIFNKPSLFLI